MNIAVFGATSEIATRFIKSKSTLFNHIILIGRNTNKLNTLFNDLQLKENVHKYILSDATDLNKMQESVDFVYNKSFNIDVVLFCIGYNHPTKFLNTSEVFFNEILKANLFSCFYFLKNVLRRTEKSKIIILSSNSGIEGFPLNSAYSAAKHGIIGLVKSIKSELPNIAINVICPGLVNTESLKKNIAKQSENSNESYSEIISRIEKNNKWLKLEDVAEAIFKTIAFENDDIIVQL